MFSEDLLMILRRWQEKGDRVVLIMDANKHVIDGAICKQLAGDDRQMKDVVYSETKGQGQKIWFRGKDPIAGIWGSSDIDIIGASYLPFEGTLGDHQPVMVDLIMSSVLGKRLKNIIPPNTLMLNTKV